MSSYVKNALKKAQSEWDSVEATEMQLLKQLEDLRADKHRLGAKIRDLTNQLAPVSTLPNELLVKILQILRDCDSVEWNDKHGDFSKPDDKGPFRLPEILVASHVSRHFREVSIAAPHLWAHINVAFSCPLGYIDSMLWRSSSTLLHLRLREGNDTDNLRPVLNKVIAESHRWLLLSVIIQTPSTLRTVSNVLMRPLSHLRTPNMFNWQHTSRGNPQDKIWPHGRLCSNDATVLTSLYLAGIDLLNCYPVAINKLTTLEIQTFGPPSYSLTYDVVMLALSSAPRLESLSFYCEIRESPRSSGSTILLPELRSLEVSFHCPTSSSCIANIYSIFQTPKLEEELTICPDEHPRGTSPHHQIFVDYIKTYGRSRYPSLRELYVWDVNRQSIDEDFFRALPLISHAGLMRFSTDIIL